MIISFHKQPIGSHFFNSLMICTDHNLLFRMHMIKITDKKHSYVHTIACRYLIEFFCVWTWIDKYTHSFCLVIFLVLILYSLINLLFIYNLFVNLSYALQVIIIDILFLKKKVFYMIATLKTSDK